MEERLKAFLDWLEAQEDSEIGTAKGLYDREEREYIFGKARGFAEASSEFIRRFHEEVK